MRPRGVLFAAVFTPLAVGLIAACAGSERSGQSSDTSPGMVGHTVARETTAFSAPAPLPPPDQWVVEDGKRSAMDDTPSVFARLRAGEEIEGWLEKDRPTLMVRCQERKTEVYVVTGMSAQPEYGEYGRYTVRVRFDSTPAETQSWSEATSSDALFAPEPIAFARRLARAHSLLVRLTPFNANPATIHFDVRGFDRHIGPIAAACGWKAETPASAKTIGDRSDHAKSMDTDAAPTQRERGTLHTESTGEYPAILAPGAAEPPYPDMLRQAGIRGEVLAEFVVDSTGRVEPGSLRILKSSHDMFSESVKVTVPRMQFLPATLDGRPVRQVVRRRFTFAPN